MSSDNDIAIVGLACHFPGARTPDEYWTNIAGARESVVPLSDDELRAAGVSESLIADPEYVKVHAPIPDLKQFDGGFFGFSPREAAILDPQHRHFLETAWEAFESSGHVPGTFAGAVGVFAGSGHHHYFSQHLLTKPELLRNVGFFLLRHTGNDKDFLPTRVSYLFNLRGPSMAVQTACSTSLAAVHLACQSLLNRECDMALAGGVTLELPEQRGYKYAEGEILSPDGKCRPFDIDSQGTVFGSGCGAVVLRRLEDALADGDTIHAVIKATAVNNDGAQKVGYLAPSVEGQAQVIAEALALANVAPSSVSYVEAHGTGTPVGDPIEVAALTQGYDGAAKGSIGLGSVKSNIGHTDTAAGVASLIKVVQALKARQLPPTLHFTAPNPACDFDASPFRVQSALAPWHSAGPRRAGISSLGVGGTNVHVIVEEAPSVVPSTPAQGPQLLTLSAKSATALARQAEQFATHLEAASGVDLADVAWTLQAGREAMPHRLSVTASDAATAAQRLRDPKVRKEAPRTAAAAAPPVAFLFAGGGAQFPGMGADLYTTVPVFRDTVEKGLAILRDRHGLDLRPLLFPATGGEAAAATELERPTRSLTALFLVQTAMARTWQSWGITPSALMGHSMGEYTAAHLAGVLTFEDGLALVFKRGSLFERVPEGGMVSVALPASEVRPMLDPRLGIAAENAPELCVVSGPDDALAEFERTLAARDIECSRVRIRIAAHSPMLDPILDEWRAFLRTIRFQPPQLPVVSNLFGGLLTDADAIDPEYWVRQLRETVRFAEGVQTLLGAGPVVLLECGPGRTLVTLARQHPARGPQHELLQSLRRPDEAGSDRGVALESLGRLWSVGVVPDWAAVHLGEVRRRVPLPTYPFERATHWIEASAPTEAAEPDDPMARRSDPGCWSTVAEWQRAAPLREQSVADALLIIGDADGFAERVADAWRAAGGRAVLAVPAADTHEAGPDLWRVSLEDAAGMSALLAGVGSMSQIVYAAAATFGADALTPGAFADARIRAFDGLASLGRALSEEGTAGVRLLVAVEGGIDPDAASPGAAVAAMAGGLAAVLASELDEARCCMADVGGTDAQAARTADALVRELAHGLPEAAIAVRAGRRWIRRLREEPPRAAGGLPVPERAVCLITGGTGGIGLALGVDLAVRAKARVALLGRSGAAAAARPDVADALARITAAGGEAMLVSADVTDASAMAAAVTSVVQRFGGLDAVFHSAGRLDDRLLTQKSPAELAAVLAPKTLGTLALDAAITPHAPALVVLFSSISSIAGLPGQADYAAANAFLDAYARWRSEARSGRTVAIGWSAWRDIGMLADSPMTRATPLASAVGLLTHAARAEAGSEELLAALAPETDWVLDEHRLATREALLPGTGFVAAAHAGAARMLGSTALELRELSFRSSFGVADGATRVLRVRSRMRPEGGAEIEVAGSLGATWETHATALALPLSAARPATLDLAAVRKRCPQTGEGPVFRSPFLAFGPRWNVVRTYAVGVQEALLSCSLAPAFAAEADAFSLHPALLDLATAGAQTLVPGFDAARDFFVPLSYGALQVWEPLGPAVESHVRLRTGSESAAVYDVTLTAPDGRVLAEISEFTMIRIADGRTLVARNAAPPKRGVAEGIDEAGGFEALARILAASSLPHLFVTPHRLPALLDDLRAQPARSTDHVEPRAAVDDSVPELEVLLARIEGVAAAAARRLTDESGEIRLVAYVVAAPGETITASHVRRALRSEGHDALVPQTVLELDALPRDEDGRVRHADLPNPFGTSRAAVAPRTATEQAIGAIWRELLGLSEIGVYDNFFDVGGHSLLAVRLINRAYKALGVRLRHEDIVVNTLEQLAARCDAAGTTAPAN